MVETSLLVSLRRIGSRCYCVDWCECRSVCWPRLFIGRNLPLPSPTGRVRSRHGPLARYVHSAYGVRRCNNRHHCMDRSRRSELDAAQLRSLLSDISSRLFALPVSGFVAFMYTSHVSAPGLRDHRKKALDRRELYVCVLCSTGIHDWYRPLDPRVD